MSFTEQTESHPHYSQETTKTQCELLGTIEGGGYEKTFEECRRVYGADGLSPSVTTKRGGYHEVKIATNNKQGYAEVKDGDFLNLQYASSSPSRGRVGEGVAQTLCCTDEQGVVIDDTYKNRLPREYSESRTALRTNCGEFKTVGDSLRIRKLTPLECWRLMNFDDEDFRKAEAIESNTQLYAQAGNSIVVNCLVAIFGQLFDGKEDVYKEK